MSLYNYDEALLRYLKDALCFDNIINAADSKAFSYVGDNNDKIKVDLPLITMWRLSNTLENVDGIGNFGWRTRGKVVHADFTDNKGVRWRALPVTLSYQITIWTYTRKELDDIFREMIMYLTTDNPHIDVKLEGMDEPEKFVIKVTDTDTSTDIDSFDDKGRLYSQNIMLDIPEAQLLFSREVPLTKDIKIKSILLDKDNDIL